MKSILFILSLFLFTSCASYVDRIHKELDREEQQNYNANYKRGYNTFDQFRAPQRSNPNGYYAPRSAPLNTVTSAQQSVIQPNIKRQYNTQEEFKKRVTARDLEDNSDEGSLWTGSGNENYLFTKNKWKKNGDIVLINVQSKLKNEITLELKRAFPDYPTRKKEQEKGPASTDPAAAAATPPAASGAEDDTASEDGDPEKVHDRISAVIVEEISKDHLLVRGQKLVLYKNQKRLIELQALVSRKDISDEDTISSSKFLESNVTVIR
ncbi:flagellar L-ring protein FlgH [Bacteriovorax sp. BSW11_IV]|uniref:flagellar basal body L-ring protein FlgH n=1 Tax=Bacteriovorax sp. BSW11_IV TaxID=1353529 RepID=UPI00038A1C84|nr:flagellar basal body L-ring protein FlgH [Bacteriovorax sp. BSW11_IV]EQC45103.1 flagellar L-ring protein FlgH [Bacteriovorax sp. BSW11_IV]